MTFYQVTGAEIFRGHRIRSLRAGSCSSSRREHEAFALATKVVSGTPDSNRKPRRISLPDTLGTHGRMYAELWHGGRTLSRERQRITSSPPEPTYRSRTPGLRAGITTATEFRLPPPGQMSPTFERSHSSRQIIAIATRLSLNSVLLVDGTSTPRRMNGHRSPRQTSVSKLAASIGTRLRTRMNLHFM